MDLIWVILAGIPGVLVMALSKQLADEFKAWTPRLVAAIVQRAVRMLRDDQRDRYAEEWRSHIDETPGEIGKLVVGLGLLQAAWKLSRIMPNPKAHQNAKAHQIELFVAAWRNAYRWKQQSYIVKILTGERCLRRLDGVLEAVRRDPHTLNEMIHLVQRLADKEPSDPILQKMAVEIDKASAKGFEEGYRRGVSGEVHHGRCRAGRDR